MVGSIMDSIGCDSSWVCLKMISCLQVKRDTITITASCHVCNQQAVFFFYVMQEEKLFVKAFFEHCGRRWLSASKEMCDTLLST